MYMQDYLNQVAAECMATLDEIGIEYGDVRDFTINRRACSRWGQCQRKPDGFHININAILCDGKHDDGLRETLYHELLHTCRGCFNHGKEWKGLANVVKAHTGYMIMRANTNNDKGVTKEEILKSYPAKYVFQCEKCGAIITRRRASRFTKHPEFYRCANCKGEIRRISA